LPGKLTLTSPGFLFQVDFYLAQSQADNHAVREAACACIAELGSKVDTGCLGKHVPSLLKGLMEAFQDDSWPVRDGAPNTIETYGWGL
jgi:hypothetical protein